MRNAWHLSDFEVGWFYGFLGAIATLYIVREYFPGLFNRTIIVKQEVVSGEPAAHPD